MTADVLHESYLKTGRLGWDDLEVSLAASRVSATAPPTLTTFRGSLAAYSFSKTVTNSVHFSVQLPHRWYPSAIEPHIHWACPTTATGNVRWELEYTWASYGAVFAEPGAALVVDAAAAGVAYQHQIADLGSLDGSAQRVSSVLVGKVSRLGGATEDTLDEVAFGLSLDFHILAYGTGGFTEYAGA